MGFGEFASGMNNLYKAFNDTLDNRVAQERARIAADQVVLDKAAAEVHTILQEAVDKKNE